MSIDVLILAGGKSSRMGGNHKGNLKIGQETFQQHLIRELAGIADTIYLSYGVTVQCQEKGCEILMDEIPDCGPIGGLVSGLKKTEQEFLAVSACDLPFMKGQFYDHLKEYLLREEERTSHRYQGVVPVVNGKMHPLTALYRKAARIDFERELMAQHYKVTRVVEMMDILYMDLSDETEYSKMLMNINTPQEYKNLVEGL